jgi:hypothetical protein
MSSALKTPIAQSINRFAQAKINDAFQREGQALPCSVVYVSGAIVTVKFEVNSKFTLPNVTIPLWGCEYIRYPIQVGCKGVTFPADARLCGMSGIGGGVADLSQPANLTALVFLPIGNTGWFHTDPNAVTIYGPNGVVIRSQDNVTNATYLPTNITVVTPNGIVTTAQEYVVGSMNVSENVTVGNGASGTFTTPQGQVVTVQDGIVTCIF